MNTLYLICYETRKNNCYSFVTLTTTNRVLAESVLIIDGRYGIEELDCITLDHDYPEPMPCYVLKKDGHLRTLFAKYRDEIEEHYKGNIEFSKQWELFNDEFGLDI